MGRFFMGRNVAASPLQSYIGAARRHRPFLTTTASSSITSRPPRLRFPAQRARAFQIDSPAPPCRFAPAGQRIRAVHTHLPRRRPFPRASGALAFKSYIVHPTSYMSSCLAAAWGRRQFSPLRGSASALSIRTYSRRACCTSYILHHTWAPLGVPLPSPSSHSRAQLHYIPFAPASPNSRAKRANFPNRTSYIVNRT